jgi:hypothetical protein
MDKKIYYRAGYKYQLAQDYYTITRIRPNLPIVTEYIKLDLAGNLIIKEGYAWDGPSGPTIDTPDTMRPSLGHDAKYQLLRLGMLQKHWRIVADEEFREDCIDDGMWFVKANLWFLMVRLFAAKAAEPRNEPPVLVAP